MKNVSTGDNKQIPINDSVAHQILMRRPQGVINEPWDINSTTNLILIYTWNGHDNSFVIITQFNILITSQLGYRVKLFA